jgi:hypothetical protein
MRIEYFVAQSGRGWTVSRGLTVRLFFRSRGDAVQAARNLADSAMGEHDRAVVRVLVDGAIDEELALHPEEMRPAPAPMEASRWLRRSSRLSRGRAGWWEDTPPANARDVK